MKNAWPVFRREFTSYFVTPMGYVVVGVFAAIMGMGFTLQFVMYSWQSQAPSAYGLTAVPDFEEQMLAPFMIFCGFLIMFLGPLVTGRLLAEERHHGTMELLLTHPLRDGEIIFGKYLAALGMLVVMMSLLAVPSLILIHFTDVEPAVLGMGALAVFLMGAAFLSWGLFISAMANNQVTAGVLTFGLWFVFFILGKIGDGMPEKIATPSAWPTTVTHSVLFLYGILRGLVRELPLDAHAAHMAQGVVEPRDIAYYLLFTAFFLFLTFRAFESRRWRG